MSRCFRFLAAAAALVALGVALPALAGVPRLVFGEDFTATYCQYCPTANCALEACDSIYNASGHQFTYVETHGNFSPPDPFVTSETSARISRYGVTGYPTVQLDGSIQDVGAMPNCSQQIAWYQSGIDGELNGSPISPVQITGDLQVNGTKATLTAHFTLLDPGSFTAHQATLYVLEDSVNCCNGYGGQHIWRNVVRMVRSTQVSLTQVGQVQNVVQVYDFSSVTPAVNPAHLKPLALYEQISGSKQIIQSSDFVPLDYSMDIPIKTASIPMGSGIAFFSGNVENIGVVSDVIGLTIDNLFGWPADFQIQGDPNWYTSYNLPLPVGQKVGITVRVQTDASKRIGAGNFSAVSQNTGRKTKIGLQVFNGSYAILLVNEDNGTNYAKNFTTSLTNLGYLYNQATDASASQMAGYDAVVWQTAYQTNTLTTQDEDNLSTYLDNGGRLYLSSMDYLTEVTLPDNFVTNYLGVASFTINTKSSTAVGVGGDPITNGMNMTLNWPVPSANRVDTVNPGAGASTIFFSNTNNSAALRFGTNNFRTVFNTICQDAFPTSGGDPNNSQDVIGNTLNWLLQGLQPTGVPSQIASISPKLMLQTGENPARNIEQLRFTLGPSSAGVVHLSFLDAGGRLVRSIETAPLKAGFQIATWNLRDDSGRPVSNGLYFAKLQTSGGSATTKIVVMR